MGFISHRARQINRVIPIKREGFLDRLRADEARSSANRFEWSVACFAAGIGIYFALGFEPDLIVLVVIAALLWGGMHIMREKPMMWRSVFAFALLVTLGMGRATWHTQAAKEYILPETRYAYTVTGWIEAIEKSGNRMRWQLRVHEFESYRDTPAPYRVRIRAKTDGFQAGDAVTVRALINGPPGPVVPGGYDPARRAYFNKLGGYGFAISTPEKVIIETQGMEHISRTISRFRYDLANRIMAAAPPDTAGLQAALLTGVRAYIEEDQIIALRTSGLAHVLAISGLHMGLLSGGTYALITFLLALISPLSRRYDVRKFAAVAGALAATGYLILSGASVSTQRAYIMAMIVFLAVILDRRAFSMRSVAVAAAITLLIHPESLISAGFQMSFAAVAALVVVYRQWDDLGQRRYGGGIIRQLASGFTTLSVTSFVAGTATAGYAVLHFNRMATYGLIGNLAAMPLFTFVVMPAALAALITMPFGLEALPLQVMGWGLDSVLRVANWVASWDGALAHIPAAPGWIIGVYSLGFLWLCLGGNMKRLAGLAVISASFVIWAVTPQPDMRVSDTGRLAFWGPGDRLYVGSERADRYGREQFVQRAGQESAEIEAYQDTLARCDALVCRAPVKNKIVSIVSQPSEVPQECAESDIVILTARRAGPVAKWNCKAILLDEQTFKAQGAVDVYMENDDIRITSAITKGRSKRPWGRRY